MELCGEHVITVIAGASWISCALDKGHEGGHRGKGNCFRHGQYFGDVGAFPQCPQWPTCSQNLTADELKRNYPEPKDSPKLAQAVAPGERKQGHSALRLDKDAQKISMFDPHPKQEPDNDLLNSICREMFECSYANLTDPIKCDMVIRSYLQVSKPCADDPHWDYCKWGENCNCGHPLIDHVPGKTCLGCGNSIYACKEFKLRGWVAFKGEPETTDAIQLRISMRELKATRDINAQLRSQLRNWETWGTVEIAVRNPNVDSYMKHWEGRALAAEEKVAELEGRIANALL
jgi:hypothetical protein